ncbi:hypothetical protein FCH28_09635 [Streptomyces piniterrae]|uniref:Uncharacterized protein n=1 Tax=Streptomyces piniterrae TaxID=2571125 RepID=A0A4U0NNZ8_9ACTN|nr:hypothetical protein [Streptomyces piniterrae]TJZ55592.1 hypothetical protein FCH28_09635 [Streptomyces piniterrae]
MRFQLLHIFLLGTLVGAITTGALWLITGHLPEVWLTLVIANLVGVAGASVLRVRRAREQQRLQRAYDRPAFGEEHRP